MRFPLAKARLSSQALLEWLAPVTERQVIAGSIRRGRPDIGDIDLVAIPRMDVTKDLLGNVASSTNLLTQEIRRRVGVEPQWTVLKTGPEVWIFQAKAWQVDLWMATPERWGTLLLWRTGSREFNIQLAERAIALGGKWNPHRDLYMHGRVIGATEEAIFDALRLRPIPPEQREAGAIWRYQIG